MAIATRPKISKERSGLRLIRNLTRDPLRYFTKLAQEEPSYAWLSVGGHRVLAVNDATAIEYVMSKNADNYLKGYFNKILRHILGKSIFLSEGDVWRKLRRDSAPSFSNKNLDQMFEPMADAVDAMFKRWDSRADAEAAVDLGLEMMRLALDIVLRALMHETKEDIANSLQRNVGLLLAEAESRIWSLLKLPQPITMKLPKYRRAKKFIREIVEEIIEARRKDQAYPEDLLSRLIDRYDTSADLKQYLESQVLSLLLAGHETTAHGLTWALYQLALHPAQKNMLLGEVGRILDGRRPNLKQIATLKYTQQVFDEALRLYPPVWTLSRESKAADELPLEDGSCVAIPKDTTVMLCCYAVQRSDKYWQNPDAFDPDHFSEDACRTRPSFAWFPFGGGPRLCLGFRFAQIESVLALAMISQRYELALVPGQTPKPIPVITLRPSEPILFRIRKKPPATLEKATSAESAVRASSDLSQCPFHSAA